MKWLFGQPARGHWRLPKPSRVTLRGLARDKEKDCRLIPAAKVEVSQELPLEVSLKIMPEPVVKVIPIVTYKTYPSVPWWTSTQEESDLQWTWSQEEPWRGTDVEMWLEFQAWQLGTPMWWEELGAIPGITDLCKFAQKMRALFYIPEVWMRASLEQGYTVPLAPWSLNRSAFLPEKLGYQDVQQHPALLTITYTWSLQYLAEKCNPPRNLDFCPLGESVRELWQTVQMFLYCQHQSMNRKLQRPSLALYPPLLRRRSYGDPPHSLRLSGATGICWLLPPQWANWT